MCAVDGQVLGIMRNVITWDRAFAVLSKYLREAWGYDGPMALFVEDKGIAVEWDPSLLKSKDDIKNANYR